MKAELIALDPTIEKNPSLDRFLQVVRLFQSRKVFNPKAVGSVVQPSLYAVPMAIFREMKGKWVKEAGVRIQRATEEHFKMGKLGPVQVLATDSSAKERHVDLLARRARKLGADALILASNDRTGLPYWFLGSFSETAALTAKIPVFIIKPSLRDADLAREPRFVLAIDAASPPTANAIRWVANLAKPSGARIDLVYVQPRKRPLIDSLQQRKSADEADGVLKRLEAAFRSKGVQAQKTILKESKSVAHTVSEHSESVKAWLTIATAPERSEARKIFLGSTARRILTLTRRPFLSLRLH